MAVPYHLTIHGRLVVVGKEPDGDSVRLIADHPKHYGQLKNAHRAHLRTLATEAREAGDGAWALDSSAEFLLDVVFVEK